MDTSNQELCASHVNPTSYGSNFNYRKNSSKEFCIHYLNNKVTDRTQGIDQDKNPLTAGLKTNFHYDTQNAVNLNGNQQNTLDFIIKANIQQQFVNDHQKSLNVSH